MDEKVLLEWKGANEEVYSKFKQDLEEQLRKPYHQTILDLGDGNAEPLKSVLVNLGAISSKDNVDINKLYSKAVETGDNSAYCLCYYLLFDNGADQLIKASIDKAKDSDTQEIINTLWEYKRFYKQNKKRETTEITTDELNCLTLRRWHYDHPKEYDEFMATFQKAYDGDMTFIQNNTFFLAEMLSFNGVKGMMKIVAALFPGNKHYQQSLMDTDGNPLKGRLGKMLDSSLNDNAIRERLLRKNPYLFSLFYWIVFDNGFLHAADLISQTFLKEDSPNWQKAIGQKAVEAFIGASIDKAHYTKERWNELVKQLQKGEAKKVIRTTLLEEKGRRGQKVTYVILEEMLLAKYVPVLIGCIEKEISEWKELEGTDTILPYIFAALVDGRFTNTEYNYRTFHAAMREKFPNYNISKGFDWAEAIYNAIMSDDEEGNYNSTISGDQIDRGRKYTADIKLRLLSAINPNIK